MAKETKPCPFCDSDITVKEYTPLNKWFALCEECGAMIPSKFSRQKVIADWNNRPSCSVYFWSCNFDNMLPYTCKHCGCEFAVKNLAVPNFCPGAGVRLLMFAVIYKVANKKILYEKRN